VTHSSRSASPPLATGSVLTGACAGVTGDCASAVVAGGGLLGLAGGGKASTSFRAGSTTPSMGDPGAESDTPPRDRSHDGERLAAARGEGDEARGRRSEAVGSGEKSSQA
jgi:hypothetical protein